MRGFRIAGCWATLALGIASALAAAPPLEWNVRPQVVGLFSRLQGGGVGTLAIAGDSVSYKPDSYNWFLRDRFWTATVWPATATSASATASGAWSRTPPRYGINYSTSATGVILGELNGGRDPWGCYTPDGLHARISGAGFMNLTFYGPACRLYCLRQPGGGVMRLALNNAPLTDVSTIGAFEQGWLDFNTGRGPYTTSTLKITSADGAVIQPGGMDMRTGLPGLVYHRLARGGAGPRDFIRANTPATAALLADLSPDALIVMLDWVGPAEKATFVADTRTLLDFYQASMPDTRFILTTHHPFKAEIYDEAVWLYQIAQERNLGFINLFAAFPGGFDEMNALGFMDGDVHLTAAGGQWFGNYVYNLH